ncbi:RND family efflux transporter MFP subunit [Pseudomonas caricapapayae]|uniref:RND family efflux transporter MFP subunit n=2 Tax=Pseudomonas syringae group TaxID=136849 RepID=A0A3M6EFY9_9PSED|nr:RND family efflux transporter MFP subunit [Pseudomonas syringae pv. helianthi]RMV09865.1 RND family efflux transporter MFP subunit [Pseudomonas savastanoi]RMV67230.1 RND family efflux transporter MFP subunit [Pseudomonas caricapapayae]
MNGPSAEPRPAYSLRLLYLLIMALPGCGDKPLREPVERPVLFTEIADRRSAPYARFAGVIQAQTGINGMQPGQKIRMSPEAGL